MKNSLCIIEKEVPCRKKEEEGHPLIVVSAMVSSSDKTRLTTDNFSISLIKLPLLGLGGTQNDDPGTKGSHSGSHLCTIIP